MIPYRVDSTWPGRFAMRPPGGAAGSEGETARRWQHVARELRIRQAVPPTQTVKRHSVDSTWPVSFASHPPGGATTQGETAPRWRHAAWELRVASARQCHRLRRRSGTLSSSRACRGCRCTRTGSSAGARTWWRACRRREGEGAPGSCPPSRSRCCTANLRKTKKNHNPTSVVILRIFLLYL